MAETATLPDRIEARRAPETCSVEEAAARLGIGRSLAYELARQNALPVPVLRFGRKLAIPVRALDRVLGVEDAPARSAASTK
jgi:excisionase family DNA binding protein